MLRARRSACGQGCCRNGRRRPLQDTLARPLQSCPRVLAPGRRADAIHRAGPVSRFVVTRTTRRRCRHARRRRSATHMPTSARGNAAGATPDRIPTARPIECPASEAASEAFAFARNAAMGIALAPVPTNPRTAKRATPSRRRIGAVATARDSGAAAVFEPIIAVEPPPERAACCGATNSAHRTTRTRKSSPRDEGSWRVPAPPQDIIGRIDISQG